MKTLLRSMPSRQRSRRGKDALTVGYPWLTLGAIVVLEGLLTPQMDVLELGAGGSTIFFARRCRLVHSYETDPAWVTAVQAALNGAGHVRLRGGSLAEIGVWLTQETPLSYDVVLVDHADPAHRSATQRLPLARLAATLVKPGGWLVVDNYRLYGMDAFPYWEWDVVTCDDIDYAGGGTRLCRRPHA